MLDDDRREYALLMWRQLVDRGADAGDELFAGDGLLGAEAEEAREHLPRVPLEAELSSSPGMTVDLHGDLEDHELERPGRETTFASETRELFEHRDRRVIGGLDGEVVELGAGDASTRRSPIGLGTRDAQQQLVELSRRTWSPD